MTHIYETFAITIPASSSGPANEILGYIAEGAHVDFQTLPQHYTFNQLVELLKGAEIQTFAGSRWASKPKYRTDPETGAVESRAYHPASKRDARMFWKAYRYANRKKMH